MFVYRDCILKCIVAATILFTSQVLANTKESPHRLTYDVYAGGIHAMTAILSVQQSQTNYKTNLSVETYGLMKRLADWRGSFRSEGWRITSDQHRPRLHISEAIWKGEVEHKEYTYSKNGNLTSYKVTEAGKNKTPDMIDPALTKHTTDILSATLDTMDSLNKTGACNQTRTIFDGDRTFDTIFKTAKTEILKQTKYNVYQGASVACTIEVKPKAGKWHEKPRGWLSVQEQGRKQGTMPTIWFAKLSNDKHAPYMPVKVQVKTDFGTLFMHLTSYKDNSNSTIKADIVSKP